MKLLNRSGLSVRPLAPFIDWCRGLPEEELAQPELVAGLGSEATLYLIDEVESEEDFQRAISTHWQRIFDNELEAWCEAPDFWPAARDLDTFLAWFAVEPQLMAFDLSAQNLLVAEYEA